MANWVDVFAVIAVAFFVFWGMQRGIMRTLLDVFAVLLAILFAGQLYRALSFTIMPFLKAQDKAVYSITFIVFWIIGFMVLELFVSYLIRLVKVTFIGMVEFLGGGLLGLIQGILIVGITIQLSLMLPLSYSTKNIYYSSISKGISVPTLTKSYSAVFGMFPRIDFFIQQRVLPAIPEKDKVPTVPQKVPTDKLKL